MKAITRTWKTLTDTFAVVGRSRSGGLYPLLAYLIILIATFTGVIPLLARGLGPAQKDLMGWSVFFLVIYLAYGVLYGVVAFCNVALVMGIARRLDGNEPASTLDLFTRTVQRLWPIGAYTVVAATLSVVSIAARLLINPLFGGLIAPRVGDKVWMRWHQLSYKIPLELAVPVIALDQPAPENIFERGEQLVTKTWGERVKPAHGIGLLALVALIVIMGYAIPTLQQGLTAGNAHQVWLGLSVLLVALSTSLQISAVVNAVFGLAAYRYATAGKSDLFPGDPSYAEDAFAPSKPASNEDEALTARRVAAPTVMGDKSAS